MKTALWVDDNAYDIKPVADLAEASYNIRFEFASTLSDAIYRLSSKAYNILIVDILIPLHYTGIDIKLDGSFYDRFKNFPGISLIEILFNKRSYGINLHTPADIVICSNYSREMTIASYPFLESNKVRHLPKSQIYDLKYFTEFLQSKKREGPVDTIPAVTKDDLFSKKLLDLESTYHDFLSFYQGLYNTVHIASENMHTEVNENLIALNIGKKEPGELHILLVKNASEFFLQCLEINKTETENLNLKEVLEKLSNQSNFQKKQEPSIPQQIKEICDYLEHALKQIKERKLSYNHEKLKSLAALINITRKYSIVEELDFTKELIIDNLLKPFKISEIDIFRNTHQSCDIVLVLGALINQGRVTANAYKVDLTPLINKSKYKLADIPKDLLKRALIEIINNGIKYCEYPQYEKPYVLIKLKDLNADFVVEVESWGPEITPSEIQDRLIFKKGYRGQKLSVNNVGYGIGLSVSDQIVKAFNGDINVTSILQPSGKFLNTFFVTIRRSI